MIKLSTRAGEEGTIIITASFTDDKGAPKAPLEFSWSWRRINGDVINNRDAVSVTPAASVDIALSGPDLAIQESSKIVTRMFTCWGTYLSDINGGTTLPWTAECAIEIENYTGIPHTQ